MPFLRYSSSYLDKQISCNLQFLPASCFCTLHFGKFLYVSCFQIHTSCYIRTTLTTHLCRDHKFHPLGSHQCTQLHLVLVQATDTVFAYYGRVLYNYNHSMIPMVSSHLDLAKFKNCSLIKLQYTPKELFQKNFNYQINIITNIEAIMVYTKSSLS